MVNILSWSLVNLSISSLAHVSIDKTQSRRSSSLFLRPTPLLYLVGQVSRDGQIDSSHSSTLRCPEAYSSCFRVCVCVSSSSSSCVLSTDDSQSPTCIPNHVHIGVMLFNRQRMIQHAWPSFASDEENKGHDWTILNDPSMTNSVRRRRKEACSHQISIEIDFCSQFQ